MVHSKSTWKAALFIGAAWLLGAGATAVAGTSVKVQATEGVAADNLLRIPQGCEIPWGDSLPVIAESVVFPTASPMVTGSDGTTLGDLSTVITQGSIAGLFAPIQDRSTFQAERVKSDALGNTIGFNGTEGGLDPDTPGRLPFQFTGPTFVASSCAKRLLVKLAVADICAPASGGAAGSVQAGKVNLWIPDNGSQFATVGKQAGVEGVGTPATLIVNRNLASNPLSSACGAGIDITVTPSAADVDANLPIPTVWGAAAIAGPASVEVVEYYNPSQDHYFMTWVPDEIAILDAGTQIMGWVRTGKTLRTYTTAQAGTSPICRYYIPPALGDSHFYGRGTAECDATGAANPGFVLEDPAFMQMYLPVAGVCPANTTEVYRVFSNRPDANHRYMTDTATRDSMVALGWLAEGDGPDLVVMCAPQ
jgi:hypothetical protein